MELSRRDVLRAGAALALATSAPISAQPLLATTSADLLPRSGRRRVVIAGGGWGGMTAARYVRQLAPDLEVVLLERNPVFWSCPMSNKWLLDIVDTGYLVHSYTAAAQQYGYTFIQTEILDVDRARKRVATAQGSVDYDWLILAPGIRYAFEPWFGNDRRAIDYTRTTYPTAYIPSSEHQHVKRKIREFKGGTFVMTLPPPPHRCPPSPYERACLMAWWYKNNKVPAKIVILDPKPRIAPITVGFRQAFEELYPDVVTHVPNAQIQEVDPFKKVVKTAVGDFKFDDALLMSPHQAGDLAWKAQAIGTAADGKPTGWAAVHPLFLHLRDDPRVFVIGDAVGAVSPQFGHYPKSGHVANRQARAVAQYIAWQAREQELKPIIIDNLCYMLVNNSPREAIAVQFDYKIGPDGNLHQTQFDDNDRREKLWAEDLRWAALAYADFLAAG
ncbi:MAG: FAD-dependent oxidoreductase [Burkholderiaceae bacterium]|nr:FAD-dependent oxidoreductase [Burkholderiaceae bacterium]